MKKYNRGKERRWAIKVKGKDETVGEAFYELGKVRVIIPGELDEIFSSISKARPKIYELGYRTKVRK